jgi:hypothetical protein
MPLGAGYRPRSPEGTVLHRVVREHLATFLEEARANSAHGYGLPGFVEREFREYLGCVSRHPHGATRRQDHGAGWKQVSAVPLIAQRTG